MTLRAVLRFPNSDLSGDNLAKARATIGNVSRPSAGSVERAFSILEFLNSSKRGWNISEISRKLGIPKSTAHVLISTLDKLGYITQYQASRRFQLSSKMVSLGRRALETTPLPNIAVPHLHWLVTESRLTGHVGILEKNQVVFVQKVDGPSLIKFDTYIGKCSELHCTGLGKALLAFQTAEVTKGLLANYPFHRFTKNTISSVAAFLTELQRVRRDGYSIDDEEEELGIRCIAAPIYSNGSVVAAVSVTGTTTQIRMEDVDKLVALTKLAAAKISAATAGGFN